MSVAPCLSFLCLVEVERRWTPIGGPLLMNKRFRLRKSSDFRLVRAEGRSFAHSLLVLYARPNGLPVSRAGFSVGKRIGKAVQRNRVKRLLRESVRLRLPEMAQGWDLLFIARAPIAGAPFERLGLAVEQLLIRAGVVSGSATKAAGRPVAERANGEGVE